MATMQNVCTTCTAPAQVRGRLAHFCEDCAVAYARRMARLRVAAPDTYRRLVNGSKVGR